MKSMWKSVSAALVVMGTASALLMTSCDKQKSMNELNSTVQKAEEQSAKAATAGKTAARGEEVTSEEDYENVFTQLASTLDEENTLQITVAEGGYIFTLLTQQGAPADKKAV